MQEANDCFRVPNQVSSQTPINLYNDRIQKYIDYFSEAEKRLRHRTDWGKPEQYKMLIDFIEWAKQNRSDECAEKMLQNWVILVRVWL